MEDGEEIPLVGVVVDLRALALGENVLDVEWVPAEAVRELLDRVEIGLVEMRSR